MNTSAPTGLRARWNRLTAADKQRVPLVAAFFGVTALLLVHAFVTVPARSKAEADLARLSGRAKQVKSVPAAVPVPRLSGKSPVVLQREVNGLKAELARQQARLAELEPRFASLTELAPNRELYASLTALADSADVQLSMLEQKGLKSDERGQPPSVERLGQLANASQYQRPLVHFEARASFRGLMQFLDGLKGLPHAVSPVWIAVEVKTDAPDGGRPRLQWLEVSMDLTL